MFILSQSNQKERGKSTAQGLAWFETSCLITFRRKTDSNWIYCILQVFQLSTSFYCNMLTQVFIFFRGGLALNEVDSDMSGHVESEGVYKELLLFCLSLQSEILTGLLWGAAPSGGWIGLSVFYVGPRVALQSAMRRLRREIMPGIPLCLRKVWIKAFTSIFLSLKSLWRKFQRAYCECVGVCVAPNVCICNVPSVVPGRWHGLGPVVQQQHMFL